ncbi:unnamed protein product [Camellia sinensis]
MYGNRISPYMYSFWYHASSQSSVYLNFRPIPTELPLHSITLFPLRSFAFREVLFSYFLSAQVMEGLWSVFGEYEFEQYGVNREQMVLSLCVGYAAALFIGTFLGMLSDLMSKGRLFDILHPAPLCWHVEENLSTSECLLGHRQDSLNDMFWIMAFTESASFMGSQVIANWLIPSNVETSVLSPSTAAVLLAILSIIFVTHGWKEVSQTAVLKDYAISFKDYMKSFKAYIFGDVCVIWILEVHIMAHTAQHLGEREFPWKKKFRDKQVWLLAWAQACVQFSIAVFWILWAPTIVADGREVRLGLIYPCFLGARMLGSTVFPWFFSGPLSLRTEDCLVYVFIVMGFVLSIVAYDYQEIGVLVALFCLFHACVGLLLPSLARLRTMYIPNELRGGMMSLSLAPANAAILFVLLQRGYYQSIENSTIMAFAALGLFSAAGCLHLLKRLGKQPHQTWHKLDGREKDGNEVAATLENQFNHVKIRVELNEEQSAERHILNVVDLHRTLQNSRWKLKGYRITKPKKVKGL